MKTLKIFLSLLILTAPALFAAPAAPLQDADAQREKVLASFIAWDTKLKTLAMFYDQETSFEGIPISSSSGRIYKKDNLIRLDVFGADGKVAQSAITDKQIIRIIDDKGKPVTTLTWKEWQDSQPNKALFDFGNYAALFESHKVVDFAKLDDGWRVVLVPAHGDTYRLEFLLDAKDFFPREISISSEGVTTKTGLRTILKNKELSGNLFK